MMPKYDPLSYHIEAIADEMCRQSPEHQSMQDEMRRKVAQAVSSVKTETRQNRSSADRYATPPVKVNDNPTGAQRGKRGK